MPAVFHQEWLAVGGGHRLHITHAGTPGGLPVLLLHGGPGSGQSPVLRQAFDAQRFHIIAPDQRGAGQSTPAGCTDANRLPDLLADLRHLHHHLGAPRWLVVGGSWGATLAVAHVTDQPEAVAGLLLRASFLARTEDINGFFDSWPAEGTAHQQMSTAWHALSAAAQCDDPAAMTGALDTAFQQGELPDQDRAALAWMVWETLRLGLPWPDAPPADALPALRQRYRIQAHYLARGCELNAPNATLLQRAAIAPDVPTLLLHGDRDAVCPPAGAVMLQRALSRPGRVPPLWWAPGAGHGPSHPAMAQRLRAALDHWALHQCWPAADPVANPGRSA